MKRLGEVIAASTLGLTAQCHQLGEPPSLGTIVRTSDDEIDIYGVVCDASTNSIDPGRQFVALGGEEETEEDIHRSHPELTQLLRTVFDVLIVAHGTNGTTRPYLPPRPARIHSLVHEASTNQIMELTSPAEFLHTILKSSTPTRDDTLAACLRLASPLHKDEQRFLVDTGKQLARLLAGDTQRLAIILRQLGG